MHFLNWGFNLVLRIGIMETIIIFLLLANILTFMLYAYDKRQALKNKWRISERILIVFTLAFGGIGALLGMLICRHKTTRMKFKIVTLIGIIVVLVPLIHIVNGLTLGRSIRFVEIEFRSGNWPAELNGYRIAFITDKHIISDDEMARVARRLNERNIDLLLLGGDFSMGNYHYQGTLREIANINTTDGIFGVDGNHDYFVRLFSAKRQYGITPLDNSGLHIREGFYLAGVQDLWNRNPNIIEAIAEANADDFVLLVSHNPDVTMQQPTAGIDLILSGHTHNGHITFFGFPIYLFRGNITEYNTRFAHGFTYSADGVPVFVSSGIGPYFNIPRVFARPEVVIFTMFSENQ